MRWLKIGEPGYLFLGGLYLQFTLAFRGGRRGWEAGPS